MSHSSDLRKPNEMNGDRSWTKPIIKVVAAGFGGALGKSTSKIFEKYSEQFGEYSAEKFFDLGVDSLTKKLGGPVPALEALYQECLRQSLADIHAEPTSKSNDDWFKNWDRCLSTLQTVSSDLIKPDKPLGDTEEFLAATMERLDAEGSALQNESQSLRLQSRKIPASLLTKLKEELPPV
jgi:hypothetical protein